MDRIGSDPDQEKARRRRRNSNHVHVRKRVARRPYGFGFIGWKLLFSIVGVLGDVIPFLGSIARLGTTVVAFALTALIGFVTIAIAWVVYRPLIGIGLMLVGAAIAAIAIKVRKPPAASPALA
jgi:fatty acid desaturase